MFDFDLRPLAWLFAAILVLAFGAAFGLGYGCRGCDYRLRSPIERADGGRR